MKKLLLFVFSITYQFAVAQDTIYLENPSFEDFPALSQTPMSWFNCGFPGTSPVDIHPVPDSEFEVTKPPKHGNTYLGMVVRSDDTYESISQKLETPLSEGKTYQVNVWLAKSPQYLSQLSGSSDQINFNTPVLFRIFGGNGYCSKTELLVESIAIEHTDWQQYEFSFTPASTLQYMHIEAFYDYDNNSSSYNGNVLVDNFSPITEVTEVTENENVVPSNSCFKLLGNPASKGSIHFSGVFGTTWQLVNASGQTLVKGKTHTGINSISTDFLSAGLYFLVCDTNTLKVVVW